MYSATKGSSILDVEANSYGVQRTKLGADGKGGRAYLISNRAICLMCGTAIALGMLACAYMLALNSQVNTAVDEQQQELKWRTIVEEEAKVKIRHIGHILEDHLEEQQRAGEDAVNFKDQVHNLMLEFESTHMLKDSTATEEEYYRKFRELQKGYLNLMQKFTGLTSTYFRKMELEAHTAEESLDMIQNLLKNDEYYPNRR